MKINRKELMRVDKKEKKLTKEDKELLKAIPSSALAPEEQKPTFDAEISRKIYSNGTRFNLKLTQVDVDDLKEIYNEIVNILE